MLVSRQSYRNNGITKEQQINSVNRKDDDDVGNLTRYHISDPKRSTRPDKISMHNSKSGGTQLTVTKQHMTQHRGGTWKVMEQPNNSKLPQTKTTRRILEVGQNRFAPLHEAEEDVMIVESSNIATTDKQKELLCEDTHYSSSNEGLKTTLVFQPCTTSEANDCIKTRQTCNLIL